jgi:hypothetical protein
MALKMKAGMKQGTCKGACTCCGAKVRTKHTGVSQRQFNPGAAHCALQYYIGASKSML